MDRPPDKNCRIAKCLVKRISDKRDIMSFLSFQVCEAYFSGFDFAVMNNAFAVHDGFKDPKEYNRNKGKQKDNFRNFKLFLVFLNDLKLKYPNSTRKCWR